MRDCVKGEINVEFVVYTGVLLFVLSLASYAAITATVGIGDDNEVVDARRLAVIIASEVNVAAEVGDGYSREFYLPELLYGGANYSAGFIETGFISINWDNKTYSLPVLAGNVTGVIAKGKNRLANAGGVIVFG